MIGPGFSAEDGEMLVRTPNWLGDAVMALDSLSGIIHTRPDTHLWCHPRVEGLYRFFFPDTPLITLPDRVPKSKFRTLLLMTSSFRSALAGFMTGIPERIGYSSQGRSPLLTEALNPHSGRRRHHCLDYQILADAVGARPRPVNPGERGEGDHLAVFPGARYGKAKVWKHYPEVVKMLGIRAVFYGTERERPMLEELARKSGAEAVPGLSIPGLAENLREASVCLGNDSGGVHLAAALGVPTVTLFCSTSPEWTAPRGTRTKVLASPSPCSPCFRRTCPDGSFRCTFDITAADAARAVLHV